MRIVGAGGTNTAALSAPAAAGGGPALARPSPRGRRNERQARTARIAIVFSVFLALLAVALLIGGRAMIDPVLQAAAERRQAHGSADIVITLHDGTRCRHLSFDNKTATLTEGTVERCAHDLRSDHGDRAKSFSWGTH